MVPVGNSQSNRFEYLVLVLFTPGIEQGDIRWLPAPSDEVLRVILACCELGEIESEPDVFRCLRYRQSKTPLHPGASGVWRYTADRKTTGQENVMELRVLLWVLESHEARPHHLLVHDPVLECLGIFELKRIQRSLIPNFG